MADEEKKSKEKQENTKEKQPIPKPKQPEPKSAPVAEIANNPKSTLPEPEKIPVKEKLPKPEEKTKPTQTLQEKTTENNKPDKPITPAPIKQKDESSTDKKEPKKTKKDKDDKPDDFQYIVRIANADINGDYPLELGLAQIKGVGRRLACLIADTSGIKRSFKMGNLTDKQIEKIREVLMNIDEIVPPWMLNHRKDFDTGKDIHHISGEVELRLRDDVNLLKMIRSYRGIRHESRLPVRGQRTRSNNRSGLTLGVSKKKP